MRDRPYYREHDASVTKVAVRRQPTRIEALIAWFLCEWGNEIKGQMHASGIEWEGPGRIVGPRQPGGAVTDPGGGNAQGAPRYHPEAKAHLFASSSRTDADGWYIEPLHWCVDWMSTRHPLKAALLRLIGRGGDWRTAVRVTCFHCGHPVTLPDEYSEAVARDALNLAYRHYERAPRGADAKYYGTDAPV